MMAFIESFKESMMITGFIFTMMLVIEYVNVQTRGAWHNKLKKSGWSQYILAALLGAIPGCLGAFTVVTLFSHGIVSFGALVATMIATSGDEAFLMLAMFPGKAILLIVLMFSIGIASGFITDKFITSDKFKSRLKENHFSIHDEDSCVCFPRGRIVGQLRQSSMERILLIGIVFMLFAGLFFGKIGPEKWNWIKGTLFFATLISLFIVATVPEHFLKEHLWDHIVKVHLPKIFLWTFGTLFVIKILMQHVDISLWIEQNIIFTLLIAVLVGIIPESGPHMVFVTLFFSGTIPFSVLLASSIVQDGHGMLPLLAESKRSFIIVKGINIIVGLVIGFLLIKIGF
ncbi:MAG: arsenic efflux protein [Candidatus Marinimicrobia bacterium]|nr:arsenic efflux protein [Candidatus Neomarinimicrobiota bacterium]